MKALRGLYQKQLEQHAKYVRYFEMRNSDNRVIYDLFFAGNHPLGHLRMKEAFWRVDPTSGFRFSDATNRNQLILFEADPSEALAPELKARFKGTERLAQEIIGFVENDTAYLTKHAKKALTLLEGAQEIEVFPFKTDGTRRTRGFASGTIIRF